MPSDGSTVVGEPCFFSSGLAEELADASVVGAVVARAPRELSAENRELNAGMRRKGMLVACRLSDCETGAVACDWSELFGGDVAVDWSRRGWFFANMGSPCEAGDSEVVSDDIGTWRVASVVSSRVVSDHVGPEKVSSEEAGAGDASSEEVDPDSVGPEELLSSDATSVATAFGADAGVDVGAGVGVDRFAVEPIGQVGFFSPKRDQTVALETVVGAAVAWVRSTAGDFASVSAARGCPLSAKVTDAAGLIVCVAARLSSRRNTWVGCAMTEGGAEAFPSAD